MVMGDICGNRPDSPTPGRSRPNAAGKLGTPGARAADARRDYGEVRRTLRKARGPQKAPTKERITIRLSRDVVGAFRSSGPGWQSRLDGALRTWLKRHDPRERAA